MSVALCSDGRAEVNERSFALALGRRTDTAGSGPCQRPKRRTSRDSIARVALRFTISCARSRHKLKYFLLEPMQHAGSRSAGVEGPGPRGREPGNGAGCFRDRT